MYAVGGYTRSLKLDEVSSHMKAMTHAGNAFVPRDLDLWPFDTIEISGFPGLTVDHVCVKFGDPSCIGFWDIVWKTKRQTDKHINAAEQWTLCPRDCGNSPRTRFYSLESAS